MPDYAIADDGTRLAWEQEGIGVPVLLVAGQATGMRGWGPFADELARDFRVIRFDHRGIDDSEAGDPAHYTTRVFAADAVAVLDAAGVQAAHVVGHSMGGRVAQWIAIDHPERVRRLVLIATSASDRAGERRDRSAVADLLSGDRQRMLPLFFDEEWASRNPQAVDAFFHRRAGRPALRGHFAASRDHDALGHLGEIRAESLVLHGSRDRLTPADHARLLAGGIPRARLIEWDAGHGLHLDTPEVARETRDFLLPPGQRRLESGPGAE